jgi:transcriptional regulator with AAA-type ATPase domain
MRRLLERAREAARSNESILLIGEPGTGKDLLAREIHRVSARSGPCISVSLEDLLDTTVEARLFGYELGAIPGAYSASDGAFRDADGGTLILDGIDTLSPASQTKLLTALETRYAYLRSSSSWCTTRRWVAPHSS